MNVRRRSILRGVFQGSAVGVALPSWTAFLMVTDKRSRPLASAYRPALARISGAVA